MSANACDRRNARARAAERSSSTCTTPFAERQKADWLGMWSNAPRRRHAVRATAHHPSTCRRAGRSAGPRQLVKHRICNLQDLRGGARRIDRGVTRWEFVGEDRHGASGAGAAAEEPLDGRVDKHSVSRRQQLWRAPPPSRSLHAGVAGGGRPTSHGSLAARCQRPLKSPQSCRVELQAAVLQVEAPSPSARHLKTPTTTVQASRSGANHDAPGDRTERTAHTSSEGHPAPRSLIVAMRPTTTWAWTKMRTAYCWTTCNGKRVKVPPEAPCGTNGPWPLPTWE